MDSNLSRLHRGLRAESRVRAHLEGLGYLFIESNFRWRGGEIDLILRSPGGELVFVEVRSAAGASPWLRHTITGAKRRHLARSMQQYLFRRPWHATAPFRFDMVWVEGERIEHWPNVAL